MISQILSSLAGFAFICFIGWFSAKKKLIDDKVTDGLSYIIISIALPASILASSNMEFTAERATGIFTVIIFSIAYYLALLIFGSITGKLLPVEDNKKKMFTLTITFGNVTFLGFPIAYLFYGTEGTFYAAVFNISFRLFMFTYGINVFASGEGVSLRDRVKEVLIQLATISTVIMIILFFLQIKLPESVVSTLDTLGVMSTPLSMLVIGALIAKVKIWSAFTNWLGYLIAFIKLLICPLTVLLILKALNVDPMIATICTVLSAMPPATMLAIFANKYKMIPEFTTKVVVLSMILYIATMPVITTIIQIVYPS